MSLLFEGRRLSVLLSSMALAAVSAGCAMDEEGGDREESDQTEERAPSRSPESPAGESELDRSFAAAAEEFGVPALLLQAWGHAETRWQMVEGGEEHPGLDPAWGIFALRGARLARAAELAGETVEAVRRDTAAHLRAGAALLAYLAAEEGIGADDDLGAWAGVVARASGIEDPEGQAQFVHDQIYAAINQGVTVQSEAGVVGSIAPAAAEPDFPAPQRGTPRLAVDFPGAISPPGSALWDLDGLGRDDQEVLRLHDAHARHGQHFSAQVQLELLGVAVHGLDRAGVRQIAELAREPGADREPEVLLEILGRAGAARATGPSRAGFRRARALIPTDPSRPAPMRIAAPRGERPGSQPPRLIPAARDEFEAASDARHPARSVRLPGSPSPAPDRGAVRRAGRRASAPTRSHPVPTSGAGVWCSRKSDRTPRAAGDRAGRGAGRGADLAGRDRALAPAWPSCGARARPPSVAALLLPGCGRGRRRSSRATSRAARSPQARALGLDHVVVEPGAIEALAARLAGANPHFRSGPCVWAAGPSIWPQPSTAGAEGRRAR